MNSSWLSRQAAQKEAAGRRKDAAVNIALEEYRQLWTWYKSTIEHRKYLFDWYFKAVELPAIVVVAGSKLSESERLLISPDVAAALLWAIFAIGLVAFWTYAMESANARNYHLALKDIREWFVGTCDELSDCITIDKHRKRPLGSFDPIKFSRGAIIAVANSGIFVAAMALPTDGSHWRRWLILGLGALAGQMLSYQLLFRWYSGAWCKRRTAGGESSRW